MQKTTINNHRGDILLVSLISIFAYLIRLIHASDPIGGFHSFNEAWYSIIATNYSGVSDFIFPQTVFGRVDYNVSPFLSQLMYFWGNISGFSKGSLVFIPIIFSVLTVPVIFALGKKLFDRNTGLIAALFYACIPVSVIVGRNIQTDPVYVFFLCSSLFLYLKATDKEHPSPALMIAAGLLFGIAFYTKQFAALLLPAIVIWELLRNRNVKWFGWWHMAFGAAALIFPGPFFIYHLLFNRDVVVNAQSVLSSSQYVSPSADTLMYIFNEYFWGCSPIVLFLAFAGLILMLIKRNSAALLILIIGIAWNWFFLHWHGHSYYILFLMPYICLAAGAAVSAIKWKPMVATVSIAIAIFCTCLSISILCTNKYGYNDIQQIVSAVNKINAGNHHRPLLIVTTDLGGSYYPILRYYGRDMDIVTEDDLGRTGMKTIVFTDDRPVIIAGFGGDPIKRMPPVTYNIYRDAYVLLIYGYQFAAEAASEHFFKVDKLSFFRNGPPKISGIKKIGMYPSCFLTGVPPGAPIPFNEDGVIDFRLSDLYDRKSGGEDKSTAEKM